MNARGGPGRSRRDLLRGAAAGAGAAALAPVLAACASSAAGAGSKSSAAPAVANPTTVLHFAPNWQGAAWNKTALALNQDYFDSNYAPTHPGVRVVVNNGSVQGGASTQIADAIAGQGFLDVFQDCCQDLVVLYTAGLLTPLDTYLKQDNIDEALWPAGHIAVLTFNGQLMALPAYDGPCVIFYRQDILDSLGLPYPDSSWTYEQATSLWKSCVGKTSKGQTRNGCSVFDSGWDEQSNWWLHAFGATEMNATRTQATYGSAQAIAMATYIQENFANGVLAPRSGFSGPLNTGQVVFKQSGGWELLPAVETMGQSIKWDILPIPYFPAGRSTFNNIDFYVMNSATKSPDAAWELIKYVCAEPDYQRFQMQATLVQPCLLSLWSEWETLVTGTAPLLKTKGIHWYQDAATGGYAWPELFFEYQAVAADNLIVNWMGQVEANKTPPAEALGQLQQQLSSLEATGASEANLTAANSKKFPTNGPAMAAMPTGI
jgi:multiple sugar transport system substrate-binding protein